MIKFGVWYLHELRETRLFSFPVYMMKYSIPVSDYVRMFTTGSATTRKYVGHKISKQTYRFIVKCAFIDIKLVICTHVRLQSLQAALLCPITLHTWSFTFHSNKLMRLPQLLDLINETSIDLLTRV